jgi:hypothetical protein
MFDFNIKLSKNKLSDMGYVKILALNRKYCIFENVFELEQQ